ncbi:MAG: SDR family oxidoreductase [Trueperaceae bacterium]|nr:SDR family oxidoreductase [Trueperaceae bacterium]
MSDASTFEPGGLAVVVGASGAIGGALADRLEQDPRFAQVLRLSRTGEPRLDLTDETTIQAAAEAAKGTGLPVRLVIDATGFLHDEDQRPEKTWRHLDRAKLAKAFDLNAIGPALVMKHFLPLLPRDGRVVFATLSARAASLSENTIGGWYGYRASKAALNALVRSAAAELGRKAKGSICVALHPGHVESKLSAPFGAGGHTSYDPDEAAANLIGVLDALEPAQSGGFFDETGVAIPY